VEQRRVRKRQQCEQDCSTASIEPLHSSTTSSVPLHWSTASSVPLHCRHAGGVTCGAARHIDMQQLRWECNCECSRALSVAADFAMHLKHACMQQADASAAIAALRRQQAVEPLLLSVLAVCCSGRTTSQFLSPSWGAYQLPRMRFRRTPPS
jgi:hypothetical protein